MADRTVKFNIGANISGLQSQLRAAQSAVQDFSKKSVSAIERNSASIDDLSNKTAALGVGLLALATAAVTRFAQFDKAMSAVAATGDDARASLDALRSAAIEAGADTAYSAEEAANAIEELAKAGVSSADILGGGLAGALSLAAAGEIDVAQAAETAASAMTQFNLKGTDVGHIADLLAAGAGKAQGGVLDMGQALNQTGLIAGQVGLSIEETTGALSAMASAGLIGSDAGTSLKTALVALSSPSKVAQKEMEKYGISLYDANGNTLSLAAVAGQLQTAFADQSAETRNAALATIFGTDALRTANVLYSEGASGIRDWTQAVNDQGFAAKQAAARTDNLLGDLERLGGSLDSVFIKAGTGANDGLRQIVQGAEAVVDAIGEIPGPVLSVVTSIAGAGGLALLGVSGLGKLTVAFAEAKSAAAALGVSTKAAGLAAGGLGAALAVGTIAFTTWAQNAADAKARTEEFQTTLGSLGETTDATLSAINERLSENQNDWIDNLLGDDPESLIDRAERVGLAVEDLQGYILGNADATEKVTQATRDYIAAQGEELTSADIRAQAGRFLTDSLDAEASSLTDAQKAAGQKKLADEAAGVAAEGMAAATDSAAESTAVYTDALAENIEAQREAAGLVLSLRDAENAAAAAYDDAKASLEENGKTLDVNTEKGRANRSALDDIAESGYDLIESMRANGSSQTDLQQTMEKTRERFVAVAKQMGLSKGEANALADELGLIPKNVNTKISADGSQARGEGKATKDYLNSLQAQIQLAADTGTAYDQANAIVDYINGLNATITIRDRHVSSGLPGSRSGGITRAGGGSVVGPGTATSDSIPAMLSNGEHVLTASDVAKMGGQAGVYSFRSALQNGLLQFADGGAVGSAGRDVERWKQELARARVELRGARDIEREAARDERRARNTDSEADDRRAARSVARAERLVKQAEQRLDRAEKALGEAQDRRRRLLEERSDLSTALRRGELQDSVTGGLSGALGITDQLRDLANSGDLGSGRARRLRNTAGRAENALTSLYKQAERVDQKITDARDHLEELQQVQSQVQSTVVGGFSLSSVVGQFDPATGKRAATGSQLAAAAKEYAGKAKRFARLLSQLGSKTRSAAVVQEVAGYGVEDGIPLAEALLADLPSLRSLAASYAAIERYGGQAGAAVARSVGGGQGLYEAQQAVKTAEAQAAAIDKRIAKWAKILGLEMARALGLKARATGGSYSAGDVVLTGERGPELEIKRTAGYVLSAEATRRLAMSAPRSYGMGGASTTYNSNLSVVTNEKVSPRTLLRYGQIARLQGVPG